MAFGAGSASERLAFLITADATGAVKGFQQVGKAADKDLKLADDRLDKLGGTMQKVGAGAIAFSLVAGKGLLSFAHASEDAATQTRKLDNSLANAPKLAGHTADEFTDLAQAIQGYSAADGDAIVGAEALAISLGLTAGQVKELTPLVVDLARKSGTDLDSAMKAAIKGTDGQGKALKGLGVDTSQIAGATDKYRATVDALSQSVGGFAREEGATFTGQVARMKNELGDLQEGIGVGVVQAMSTMIRATTGVTDALAGTSAGTQSMLGQVATYGVALIGAAGGASFLIGSLIKMRDNFGQARDSISSFATGLTSSTGGLRNFVLGAGVAAAGVVALGLVWQAAEHSAEENRKRVESLTEALKNQAQSGIAGVNTAISQNLLEFDKWAKAFRDSGADLSVFITAIRDGSNDAGELGRVLAANGRDVESLRESFQSGELAGNKLAEELLRLADAGTLTDDQLRNMLTASQSTNNAFRDGSSEAARWAQAQQGAAVATDEATRAGEDHVLSLQEEEQAFADASNAALGYIGTVTGVFEAGMRAKESQDALNEMVRQGKTGTDEYNQALLQAVNDTNAQAKASADLAVQQHVLAGGTADASFTAAVYRGELGKVRDSMAVGSPLRAALDGLIADLDRQYTVSVNTYSASAAVAALKSALQGLADATREGRDVLATVGRASGGPVEPGQRVLWNEAGGRGEVMQMGGTRGQVYPEYRTGRGLNSGGQSGPVNVTLVLDGKVLAKVMAPYLRSNQRSRG